jgi:hypothetical protein
MSSNKFGVKTLVLDELALLATLNISQVSMAHIIHHQPTFIVL